MPAEPIVYVVDDDAATRDSMEWLCRSASLGCATYASIAAFLGADRANVPSCLILDLRFDGECGLDLVESWRARGEPGIPVIVISGTGDVAQAVRGMKLGVVDFLEKPADPQLLLALVREAFAADKRRRSAAADRAAIRTRLQRLTQRERELVHLVCNGMSNKQIASRLQISIKTVANHRASVLAKANALNTADMVRLAMIANEG